MVKPERRCMATSQPPWADPVQWLFINRRLAGVCGSNGRDLTEARGHAGRIENILESIFPLMDHWCRATCPNCREVCCRMAWIWLDEKDLIFLHLSGARVPEMQLTGTPAETCRGFGPAGCQLPRPSRPWRCTRFLCRPHEALLRKMPRHGQRAFQRQIADIDHARNAMAKAFMEAWMNSPEIEADRPAKKSRPGGPYHRLPQGGGRVLPVTSDHW